METKKTDWPLTTATILMVLGVFSIFFPFNSIDGFHFLKYKIEIGKYGELGDFVNGMSTPFISVAVFILLYRTYKSQKQELHDTKILLSEQNETLTTQQFETTFFNLITLHHQIINNIDFDSSLDVEMYDKETDGEPTILKGRDCIRQFYYIFLSKYRDWESEKKRTPTERSTFKAKLERELISSAYSRFYSEHETDIGHYFRNLESVIKLVDKSKIIEKEFYFELISAQLSTYEILLLFYSCLWTDESTMRKFVVKYHLLRGIDHQSLIHMEHISLIDKEAYS
jgi:Putative phage abortive infection protein